MHPQDDAVYIQLTPAQSPDLSVVLELPWSAGPEDAIEALADLDLDGPGSTPRLVRVAAHAKAELRH